MTTGENNTMWPATLLYTPVKYWFTVFMWKGPISEQSLNHPKAIIQKRRKNTFASWEPVKRTDSNG